MTTIPVHSPCRKFTSKAAQIPDLLKQMDPDEYALTVQYTCLKTGAVVGPDNNVVRPDECKTGRDCFEET